MFRKLIWNDIRQNKLISVSACLFMAVSAMLFGVTVFLFISLTSSVGSLMEKAQTPDFLQMHAGECSEKEIQAFAESHEAVSRWQISRFLNLENGMLALNGQSLSDSTQDNGICVQNKSFDYLLAMTDAEEMPDAEERPNVSKGEVYVPVCYMQQYDLHEGDTMQIGTMELVVAGFIRDSQMNSMMASSKRFLVSGEDYARILPLGTEEYLIEFLLKDKNELQGFAKAYTDAGLPANGPTITYPLICMMNALSDGLMIFVVLLAAVMITLLSMLCIRFILLTGMEKDRREIGMLKAIGIGKRQIRFLYFIKFLALSGTGMLLGLLAAYALQGPLAKQIEQLYGGAKNEIWIYALSALCVTLVTSLQLFSLWRLLARTEKLSAVKCLQGIPDGKKKGTFRQYAFICGACAVSMALMLIPQNLKNTISSPEFVNYMGIGDGEIRLDVRQTADMPGKTQKLQEALQADTDVEQFSPLQTISCLAVLSDGSNINLTIETGNHSLFPVRYASGHEPRKKNELALSVLNAKELGLAIGDKIFLSKEDGQEEYVICGVYSDITNGGKTAKAVEVPMEMPGGGQIMWSIFYVTLRENVTQEDWIAAYQDRWSKEGGVKVISIQDYVQGTYGQTIAQIRLAAAVAVLAAAVILWIVVVLFMGLVIQEQRYDISLKKAIGFAGAQMERMYLIKSAFAILWGIIIGLLLGNFAGNKIAAGCLSSMGAAGFTLIPDGKIVFAVIPLLIFAIALSAAKIGMSGMKNIRAYECCMGERN